jgi:hypothetical protein
MRASASLTNSDSPTLELSRIHSGNQFSEEPEIYLRCTTLVVAGIVHQQKAFVIKAEYLEAIWRVEAVPSIAKRGR